MKYLIFICVLAGGLLLYLLSSASANTDLFSRNYYVLLTIAGVLALSLALLVGYQLWQLRGKLGRGLLHPGDHGWPIADRHADIVERIV